MRRAQIEIIGLMVIFILFVFIGLLYLKFSGGPKEEPMAVSRMNLEGANMVSSLMSYTICEENSFRDALRTCIDGDQPMCGTTSCKAVETTAEAAVKAIMGNQTYQFLIIAAGNELVKLPENAPKCKKTTVNIYNNTLVRDTYVKTLICQKGTEITQNTAK